MATKICAQRPPTSTLDTKPVYALCEDHINGVCSRPDVCGPAHTICHIQPDCKKPKVSSSMNYMSLHPRSASKFHQFEDDGPGNLSKHGARHDNDFLRIRDIQVLPTTDEIISLRAPYVPFKDPQTRHFLAKGFNRYSDSSFRQLREDNIEILKDVSYDAAQLLALKAQPPDDYKPTRETSNGRRYSLFWDVGFEELRHHHEKGLMVRISFACPKPLRGLRIHKSGHLESGMMAALVGLDDDGHSLSVTFFEVHLRESTDSNYSKGKPNELRAGVQLVFAERNNADDVRRMIYYSQNMLKGRFVLVEFPCILLVGFSWCLRRLQQLQKEDVSFHEYYATSGNFMPALKPPEYATDSSFQFDLSMIAKDPSIPLRFSLNDVLADPKGFLKILEQRTTLDEGQAQALLHSLTSNLAFTQGPPGTGKTYLGVALTKTILASMPPGSPPIVAVCMTNHALDSFIGDLAKGGVSKIVRLGGGSKDPSMGKYGMRAVTGKTSWTDEERSAKGKATHGREYYVKELEHRSNGLKGSSNELGWFYIQNHLREHYPNILAQLEGLGTEGLEVPEVAMKADGFAYEFWCSGGDLANLLEVHTEFHNYLDIDMIKFHPLTPSIPAYHVLAGILERYQQTKLDAGVLIGQANIWRLSVMKRQLLVQKWTREIDLRRMFDELVEIHCRLQKAVEKRHLVEEDIDARCLADKQVIGMTTTGCAKNFRMLQKLGVKVCVCEEAGEVIEPHTLCTMFASLEHSIFIGDPLQLRPQVNEKVLSIEQSNAYRLDESLFERFMNNSMAFKSVPTSRLTIQRRMHPDIAELCRRTLYPDLKDHPSTVLHPKVANLVARSYWFDHREAEDGRDLDSIHSKSCSNKFEVKMVAGLVNYLVKTNAYGLGEIAVLTPYNGQLAALAENMHGDCAIMLNEKDRHALFDDGLISDEDEFSTSRVNVDVQDMLRLATVDNFQGEEAKVVILTTVRSNDKGRSGFLKTENRINVACSRARDGFYIIGNSETLKGVPMWEKIIDVFKSRGRLGSSLRTCCSRHPEHSFEIKEPKHFESVRKCDVQCGQTLECGHMCPEVCHPEELHKMIQCTWTTKTRLKCGHEAEVTCSGSKTGQVPRCKAILLSSIKLPCGHTVEVRCHASKEMHSCTQVCNAPMPCGHLCLGKCQDCRNSNEHPPCSISCGKEMPCGHSCNVECHSGPCDPCKQNCEHACSHGKCKNRCGVTCDPCVKPCAKKGCTMMCCLPCNIQLEVSDDVPIEDSAFDVPLFVDTVDRMVAKMGRKLDKHSGALNHGRIELNNGSASFLSSIRPNPLAAKENSRLVKARLNSLDDAQTRIINIRDQVVIPFEENMETLHKSGLIGETTNYNFSFGLRFHLLYYKSCYIVLEEAWNVSKYLASLKGDPSLQTSEFAEGLRQKAIQDSEKMADKAKELIAKCAKKELACLEVQFHCLLFQFVGLINRAKKNMSTPDLTKTLSRATFLCRSYPDTAGKFISHLTLLRQGISANNLPKYPEINEGRVLENALGSHEYGHLTTCVNKHPYSSGTFKGCPECGRKVETTQQGSDGGYEKYLFEEEFMRRISRGNTPSSRDPSPSSDTSRA